MQPDAPDKNQSRPSSSIGHGLAKLRYDTAAFLVFTVTIPISCGSLQLNLVEHTVAQHVCLVGFANDFKGN